MSAPQQHISGASELVSTQLKTLLDLAKLAPAITLKKSLIKSTQSGGYRSRIKGRGMAFDETRPYQPGDDIRSIDWRVTARSDKTHTKIYQEERERPVFISVDYRPAMQFATRGVFKSVQAAKIAALLAWSAQKQGDRIGGQLFSNQGYQALKPKNGKHAVLHYLNALSSPRFTAQKNMTLSDVIARLVQHARPGSLVYIISDFRGLNERSEMHLSKLSRHCEVVLIHVYDPFEKQLPAKGHYRLSNGVRNIFIDSGDKQRLQKHQQRFQAHQDALQTLSKKWQLRLLTCSTEDNPLEVLR